MTKDLGDFVLVDFEHVYSTSTSSSMGGSPTPSRVSDTDDEFIMVGGFSYAEIAKNHGKARADDKKPCVKQLVVVGSSVVPTLPVGGGAGEMETKQAIGFDDKWLNEIDFKRSGMRKGKGKQALRKVHEKPSKQEKKVSLRQQAKDF